MRDLFIKLAKYANIAMDIGFMLSGFLLIVVGAFAYSEGLQGFSSQYITVGLIVIGCFFFLVAILGLLGFVRGNKGFVTAYIVFVCFFILIELVLAIAAYAKRDDFPAIAYTTWQHLFYYDHKAIITIEQNLECCGWFNFTDYAVPENCQVANGFEFLTGCQQQVDAAVEDSYQTAGGIAVALAVLQFLALVLAAFTVHYLKKSEASQPQELIEDEMENI